MSDLFLYTKLSSLSDELKKEVSTFIDKLKKQSKNKYAPKNRILGLAKGKVTLSKDFDSPVKDFEDYQ